MKVTRWPNMRKMQYWSPNFILMCQVGAFVDQKDLLLNISENLGSKDKRSRLPYDQIWAKLKFRTHNCIRMNQMATFVNPKGLLGQCQVHVFLKDWVPKVKCPGHYKIWAKMQFLSYKIILIYQLAIFFFNWNNLLGHCCGFLKFDVQMLKFKVVTWTLMAKVQFWRLWTWVHSTVLAATNYQVHLGCVPYIYTKG